jgi:hypothetical protein
VLSALFINISETEERLRVRLKYTWVMVGGWTSNRHTLISTLLQISIHGYAKELIEHVIRTVIVKKLTYLTCGE